MGDSDSVAIAHEKLLSYGGAQNVAFELARGFDAPIFTGWKDEAYIPDDVDVRQLFSRRSKQLLKAPVAVADAYHMLQWQHVPELYDYDTVIINKSNCLWFVPRREQTVIYYSHSTPRTTYDRWHLLDPSFKTRIAETIKRTVYRHPYDYPDKIVANSEVVAERYQRYYNIKVGDVVHPPVDVDSIDPNAAVTDGYYLTLGRLEHNKRVGEILEAVDKTGDELIVAGDGSERKRLERLANGATTFVGSVTDREKGELLAGAKAFIFNAEQEDFGITPIESMAAGTPVVGVNEGNTPNQITDGETGILFERGELVDAIERVDTVDWDERILTRFAQQFSVQRFHERMQEVVDDT